MRRAWLWLRALAFTLAMVLGFLVAAGLTGCERIGSPWSGAPASAPAASSPLPLPLLPASEPTPSLADLEAGERLAAEGSGGTPACATCHGARGEGQAGSPTASFPRLAGLGAAYLRRQLDAYAQGARQSPIMGPIAQALKTDQRRQVAAYFGAMESPAGARASRASTPTSAPAATSATASASAPASALTSTSAPTSAPTSARAPAAASAVMSWPAPDSLAARLAWQGDESRQLMACANCHGRDGSGQGERLPPLAGQPVAYLQAALDAWRDGRRDTDPSGEMPRIARALRPAEIQALAAWYAALPVPPSAARRGLAFASTLPALTSGPVTKASAAQGTGTEQGAPLTGGGVGPGGGGGTQAAPAQRASQPP